MILGLSLGPACPASLPDLRDIAMLCEEGRLDFILAGYAPPEAMPAWDPLSLVSALVGVTVHIGLAATIPTDGWAPFNVARALSALDLLSGGRAAWLASPGDDQGRSREHLEATFALMDSWEDGALVFDKERCVFTDSAKVHRIRHSGRWFTVDGPLNSPRPPQGRPVLLQGQSSFTHDQADVRLMDLPFTLGPGSGQGPEAMAERLAREFEAGRAIGFNLMPANLARDTHALVRWVIPWLQARGLAQLDYGDGDLRTRLGLKRPANRFAT